MPDPTSTPAPAPAPAPSPAPTPTSTPPAPAPTPTPTPTPTPSPEPTPAPTPAPTDEFAFLPEKYRVNDAEGKLDLKASSLKMSEGLAAAVKRIGSGELPPATPADYTYTPPEAYKDIPLDEGLSNAFRERAHKAGLDQKQFEFVMGEYYELVPSLLDAQTKFSTEQASAELSRVWGDEAAVKANKAHAEKAISLMPAELQEKIKTQYGSDPTFWQFAAHFGKEAGEDKPAGGDGSAAPVSNVEAIMATEAYRNPKHPDHAKVSEQVRKHFEAQQGGTAAVL